jgi:hypothetical protein
MKWRIGDDCLVPWRKGFHEIGGWHRAKVVALRRETILVESYGWTYEHPRHELRPLIHRRARDVPLS